MPFCFYYWILTGKYRLERLSKMENLCFLHLIFYFLFLDLHCSEWCFFFYISIYGSSHWRCAVKKRYSQKFRNFHRKTPVLESLLNKVAGLGLQFYQKETSTQVFSCEVCKIFKSTYFEGHLWTTASEFIRDTALLHETILEKNIQMEKPIFKMGKSITRSNILNGK